MLLSLSLFQLGSALRSCRCCGLNCFCNISFCTGWFTCAIVGFLQELCQANSIACEIVQPSINGDDLISSTRIRGLVKEGDVAAAARMLTQPYRIRGMVVHGAKRGAGIGFPTANLDAIDTLIPANGVYAGRTYVDGRSHWSAIHIGPNPTFSEHLPKVESHLLNFEGSIYGEAIEVDFISRLRDIRQFETPRQLTDQLDLDVQSTRAIARRYSDL